MLDERSSVEWLDLLLAGHPSVRRKLYSVVANVLDRHHGKMLMKFKETLAFIPNHVEEDNTVTTIDRTVFVF